MSATQTVRIASDLFEGGHLTINASDFDVEKHELFGTPEEIAAATEMLAELHARAAANSFKVTIPCPLGGAPVEFVPTGRQEADRVESLRREFASEARQAFLDRARRSD